MTTPKAKFAGLALIAVMCAGFTLGLTAVRRWERGAVSGYVFRCGRSAASRGGQKCGFLVWFHQPARASG